MKGLATICVLFSVLAVVLVYAATNGLGMRSTGFAPVNFVHLQARAQPFGATTPMVDIEAKHPSASAAVSTLPPPEVRIVRRRHRPAPVKAAATTPNPTPAVKPASTAKPQVHKVDKPKPKPVETPAPQKAAEVPQAPPAPEYHPRDVSDSGPQAQLESDRDWRKRTLERWRNEARESRDGAENVVTSRTTSGEDPNLKGSSVEGLYPADGQADKPKKKKKRHRFLFIRW